MNKVLKVGVLGLGVVGSELVKIINENQIKIKNIYNTNLIVEKVWVRDINKKRNVNVRVDQLTTNIDEVISNKDIEIICECIGGGGIEIAKEAILKAINNNKSIIMSSKKVLALHGMEILNLVHEKNIKFRFDATVGGGIPIAKVLNMCFKGENIKKIIGIVNATSNFLYSKMEKDGLSFSDALKIAQEYGYAENDPSEDIDGYDALYKAIILVAFSMKKWVDFSLLKTSSYSKVSLQDMKYADELGFRVKPLIIIENKDDVLIYRIGPCLIKKDHITANTVENYNIIVLEGSRSGPLGFYGQGAGSSPTAITMFDDLINVLGEPSNNFEDEVISNLNAISNVREYENNLYWRIEVENQIGKLALITSILASNQVNVEKIIQKDESRDKVGIVLLTSSLDSKTIDNIIEKFSANNINIISIIPFFS